MIQFSFSDYTQALRDAGVITRQQHITINYHCKAKANQIDEQNEAFHREIMDEIDVHGQG